jgi:hypothetical protein
MVLTPLPLPDGIQYVTELAINHSEVIVGTGFRVNGTIGLIWRQDEVAELTTLLDTGSFIVTEANDIAENGIIAGQVQAYGDTRSGEAATISII